MGNAQWRNVVGILFLVLSPCMGNAAQNLSATETMMNALQSPWNNWRPYLQEKLAFFPGVLSFTRSHYKTIAALALVAGVSVYAWKKLRVQPRQQRQGSEPVIPAQPPPAPVHPQVPPQSQAASQQEPQVILPPSPSLVPSAPSQLQSQFSPKEIAQQLYNNFVQLLEELIERIKKEIAIKPIMQAELYIDERKAVLEVWNKVIPSEGEFIYIDEEHAIQTLFAALYQDIRKMEQIHDVKSLQESIVKIYTFLDVCQKNINSLKFKFIVIQAWFGKQVVKFIDPLIQQLEPQQQLLPLTASSAQIEPTESYVSSPPESVPQLVEQQNRRLALLEQVYENRVLLGHKYRTLRHNFVKKIDALKPSAIVGTSQEQQKYRSQMTRLLWTEWCNIFREGNIIVDKESSLRSLISSDLRRAGIESSSVTIAIKKLEQFLYNCTAVFTNKDDVLVKGLQQIAIWLQEALKKDIQPYLDAIEKLNLELQRLEQSMQALH